MGKSRARGLIKEMKDVLVLVAELDTNEQKTCAEALGHLVVATEERNTMTEEQREILAELRYKEREEERRWMLAEVRRAIDRLGKKN